MNDFQNILVAGAATLKKMEFWCITHRDGDLKDTASKDMTVPVKIFCDACEMDWDDAVASGFALGKVMLTETQACKIPESQLLGGLADLMKSH